MLDFLEGSLLTIFPDPRVPLAEKVMKSFACSAKLGMNLASWLIMPKNWRNSEVLLGSFIAWMALTFSGSG